MIKIPLSQGEFALIDDQSYSLVSMFKWRLYRNKANPRLTPYAMTTASKKTLFMHKLILKSGKNEVVDHINGNGLDNRMSNLRAVSYAQNCQNRETNYGSSKFKGVSLYKPNKSWHAQIKKGKNYSLGYFKDEVEAAKAYDRKAIELFGEYARINFPDNL